MGRIWKGRRVRDWAVGVVLCVSAIWHIGAQERTRVPDAPCKAANGVNRTTQCLLATARKEDRELERMTRVIRQALKPEELKDFEAAQVRWYPFREANCIAERDLYTELATSTLAYVSCAEAETRQRVDELKIMYAWLFR